MLATFFFVWVFLLRKRGGFWYNGGIVCLSVIIDEAMGV